MDRLFDIIGAAFSQESFNDCLIRLAKQDMTGEEHAAFWDGLWKLKGSQQLWQQVPAKTLRKLRNKQFPNLEALLVQATAQMCQIVQTPCEEYFGQVLACIRLLTKLIPILLEKDHPDLMDEKLELLCWGREGLIANEEEEDDDDDEEEDAYVVVDSESPSSQADDVEPAKMTREEAQAAAGAAIDKAMAKMMLAPQSTSPAADAVANKNGSLDEGTPNAQKEDPVIQSRDSMDSIPNGDAHSINTHKARTTRETPSPEEVKQKDTVVPDQKQATPKPQSPQEQTPKPSIETSNANQQEEESEPLAPLLVHTVMQMLFLPGFSSKNYELSSPDDLTYKLRDLDTEYDLDLKKKAGLSETKQVDEGFMLCPVPASKVWAAGVAVTGAQKESAHSVRKYDAVRVELLRLLLAICSGAMFKVAEKESTLHLLRWTGLATSADAPNTNCLFYSLLNTVFNFDPAAYMLALYGQDIQIKENHLKLVETSAQLLCALLDDGITGSSDPVVDLLNMPVFDAETMREDGFNIHRALLARIDSTEDLTFIFNGFVRLLRNSCDDSVSFLPTSSAKVSCSQELILLLWIFLNENPLFMEHILTSCDTNALVVSICTLMNNGRRDSARNGLIRICTLVLLKLSSERQFGVNLREPFKGYPSGDLPNFSGGYSDIIPITMHRLIVKGNPNLVPLHNSFVTIIRNISPYWCKMSTAAAFKLVKLFEFFASPKHLYVGKDSVRILENLLHVYNNIIHYQYMENIPLIYAIVMGKTSFIRMSKLTFENTLDECDQVQLDNQSVNSDDRDGDGDGDSSCASQELSPQDFLNHFATADANDNDNTVIVTMVPNQAASIEPTEEWFDDMQERLSMDTIVRLLHHLSPVLDKLINKSDDKVDDKEVLSILQDRTLVGLLPSPHAIISEKFETNAFTKVWVTAFIWGVIFLRNQDLSMFDGKHIKLFNVNTAS